MTKKVNDVDLVSLLREIAVEVDEATTNKTRKLVDVFLPLVHNLIFGTYEEFRPEKNRAIEITIRMIANEIKAIDKVLYQHLNDFFPEGVVVCAGDFEKEVSHEEWIIIQDQIYCTMLVDKALLLASVSNELIKIRCSELIEKEVEEQFSESLPNGSNWFLSDFSQYQREMILLNLDIIDKELHNKIAASRRFRNKLIHELNAFYYPEEDVAVLMENLNSSIDAIAELNQLLGNPSELDTVTLV